MSLQTSLTRAATDTEQGTNGANGADATFGDGGAGDPGGDATASAISTDASNTATATGGVGGTGGMGGSDPGNGGAGGANGSATAIAQNTVSVAGPASASAFAYGGGFVGTAAAGGMGGVASQINFIGGAGGAGADGGAAQASAIASNTTNDPVTVSAAAYGGIPGPGGNGGYNGQIGLGGPGGNSGVASLGQVSGTSTGGGDVTVTGYVEGVYGGTDGDGYGARAGNGADESLVNAVSGSTSGFLTLVQTVYAGDAGWDQFGAPGIAGNARSILNLTEDNVAELVGTVNAIGGSGSPVYALQGTNVDGGAGGTACAEINLISNASISASAFSNNWRGSNSGYGGSRGYAGGGTAGAGGAGTATATATGTGTTSGSSQVTVNATAAGQAGGDVVDSSTANCG